MMANGDLIRDCSLAIDALRRRVVPLRAEARLLDIPGGFLTLHPPSRDEEFASQNKNAACWYAPGRTVTSSDIEHVVDIFEREELPRAFMWFGPRASDVGTQEALIAHGAKRVPWVTYPVLSRSVEAMPSDTDASAVETRQLKGAEQAAFLKHIAPWYSEGGVKVAAMLADRRLAELFGAWIDGEPAAMAALIPTLTCGNVGWAGTDPKFRRRGCQSALIRARIIRARELELTWCIAETVTADMTSTNNLLRAGFSETFAWEVWEWKA